jgi:hypothetical protein
MKNMVLPTIKGILSTWELNLTDHHMKEMPLPSKCADVLQMWSTFTYQKELGDEVWRTVKNLSDNVIQYRL